MKARIKLDEESFASTNNILGMSFLIAIIVILAIFIVKIEAEPTFGTNPESRPLEFIAGQDEMSVWDKSDGGKTHHFCLDGHFTKIHVAGDGSLELIEYVAIESC